MTLSDTPILASEHEVTASAVTGAHKATSGRAAWWADVVLSLEGVAEPLPTTFGPYSTRRAALGCDPLDGCRTWATVADGRIVAKRSRFGRPRPMVDPAGVAS